MKIIRKWQDPGYGEPDFNCELFKIGSAYRRKDTHIASGEIRWFKSNEDGEELQQIRK